VPNSLEFVEFGQHLIFGTKSSKIWYWNVFIFIFNTLPYSA